MKISAVRAAWLRATIPPERAHVSDFGRNDSFNTCLIEIDTDHGLTGVGEAKVGVGNLGNYAGVERDDCLIHLSQKGNPNTAAPGSGTLYIFCDDVDSFYREITERGGTVDKPPQDYPYGMRDFAAFDPDRNRVSFGTPTKQN